MAKVNGPFMSLEASGTLANTLTASKWKGRPYMRLRVIPANPQTALQKTARAILGTIAKACTCVLTSYADVATYGSEFFQKARDMAPSGQSWISFLQKVMNPLFASVVTAYGSVTPTVKGYYDTGATSCGLASYTDVNSVVHTGGEQLYGMAYFAVNTLLYAGFAGGINSATSAEITSFVTYIHSSHS